MIERPLTHITEEADKVADLYLEHLGLEWSQLVGKKVLDIGAMNAAFEHAARRRGVDVISVDKDLTEGNLAPPQDSNFVVAKATQLPFGNEAFDYAIAHMSTMNYIEDSYDFETQYEKYVEDVLRETCRVLKTGGQFLFTRSLFDEEEFRDGDELVPEIGTEAYDAWQAEREHRLIDAMAKRAGFKELRVVRYAGEQLARAKANYTDDMTHYFIAVK